MLKIKWMIIPAIFFCSKPAYSQDEEIVDVRNVSKVTIFNPGVSYELKIGKRQTLYAQAFMNVTAYYSYSSALGTQSGVNLHPAATLQYRYYYNSMTRYEKGRRTEMNSMNFLAPFFETYFVKQKSDYYSFENNFRPYTTVGVVWGFQRNYKNRFSLDFLVGPGYYFTREEYYNPAEPSVKITQSYSDFSLIAQINIGFWLNKKH